jgi:spore coat protein U-like protein
VYFKLVALGLFCAASSAHAITSCSITTAMSAFGDYDDQMPALDSNSGGVTVTCTVNSAPAPGSVPYEVRASSGYASSFSPRQMRNLTNNSFVLSYNLYINSSRNVTSIWGDGTSGSVSFFGAVTQLDTVGVERRSEHIVYGRIPAGQRPLAVGQYSDNLVVTLIF